MGNNPPLPDLVQHWLQSENCPTRLLISGGGARALSLAIDLAASLQEESSYLISQQLHSDTLLLRDVGESFTIATKQNTTVNDNPWDNARALQSWISQTCVANYRVVIIEHMERASDTAPQAMLKILEEPPSQARFIFTTVNHYALPATILSRMTILRLPTPASETVVDEDLLLFAQAKNPLLRLQHVERLYNDFKKKSDKNIYLNFLNQLICHCRQQSELHTKLTLLWSCYQDIKRNVNARLCLEHLALAW